MSLPPILTRMATIFTLFIVAGTASATPRNEPAIVDTFRVPDGGVQPQIIRGNDGTLHMIYFVGHPMQGNIFYIKSSDDGKTYGEAIRVNSQELSASIGARFALGKSSRVHVAWNGSPKAEPKAPGDSLPLLYARSNDAGTGFSEQRNIIQSHPHLDGGSSIAADSMGNVYVSWHAPIEGGHGEPDRRIWVSRSTDDGKTFETETNASVATTGACACCAVRSFADSKGNLFVMYRIASKVVNRDMHLLVSSDQGQTFSNTKIQKWNVGYCVMSTASMVEHEDVIYAAWETKKQIYFGRVNPVTGEILNQTPAPGSGKNRKHPVLSVNTDGQILLAWTEGTSWGKGGSIAWQVYSPQGEALTSESGSIDGLPAYSSVIAFSTGSKFTLAY